LTHECTSSSRLKEESSLIGSFESSKVKVFRCRWRYKSYQRFHDDSHRRTDCKLYKVTESIIIGDASAATEKDDTIRLWHMPLGYMSERVIQVLHKKGILSGIKYCKLDLYKFYIMDRQLRVAFSTSQHKIKGLLDSYTRMCGDLRH